MAATGAIASLTFSNHLRQPMTWLVVALGLVLLCFSLFFGVFTWEDDDRIRLLTSTGVASASIMGIFLGIFLVSQAIHDELASRTALTLFAKPISRGSFLIGKTLGAMALVTCALVIFASVHCVLLWYGLSRGFGIRPEAADVVFFSWGRVFGAHVLALTGALVMTALAAALACRIPLIPNLIICFGIFILAHLIGPMFHAAALVPPLAIFAVDDTLLLKSMTMTPGFLCTAVGTGVLYAIAVLSLGLVAFERSDIP